MILVDTSVLVAWLDKTHAHHAACTAALEHWAGKDELAVSSVTYGELAAGARTRESVDEWLSGFRRAAHTVGESLAATQGHGECYQGTMVGAAGFEPATYSV